MKQRTAQFLNQINLSPESKSEWPQYLKNIVTMSDDEWEEYEKSLDLSVSNQLNGLSNQIYGESINNWRIEMASNPKILELYSSDSDDL